MSLKDLSDSLTDASGFEYPRQHDDFEVTAQIKNVVQYKMLTAQFPDSFMDKMNKHIDENVIPKDEDNSGMLVGQINRNVKSKQLVFPLDDEFGKVFKSNIDGIASNLIQNPTGYNRPNKVECFEAWTVHSYEGDYNPLHSHGVDSDAGLSMILYLKVPECIEKKPIVNNPLQYASGAIDGYTGLISSTNSSEDLNRLKLNGQHYVKPKKGLCLLFPSWLQHCVMPFFGEGERRTMSANFNIDDNRVKRSEVEKNEINNGAK